MLPVLVHRKGPLGISLAPVRVHATEVEVESHKHFLGLRQVERKALSASVGADSFEPRVLEVVVVVGDGHDIEGLLEVADGHEEEAVVAVDKGHLLLEVVSPVWVVVAPRSLVRVARPGISHPYHLLGIAVLVHDCVATDDGVGMSWNEAEHRGVRGSCERVQVQLPLVDESPNRVLCKLGCLVLVARSADKNAHRLRHPAKTNAFVVLVNFRECFLEKGNPPTAV